MSKRNTDEQAVKSHQKNTIVNYYVVGPHFDARPQILPLLGSEMDVELGAAFLAERSLPHCRQRSS
jgi:hypothetical protein